MPRLMIPEVGGSRGREALDRLRNVTARIDSTWRPASAEESFEIVRRRLFEPLLDPQQFQDRDLIARAFADSYKHQSEEFPVECREAEYEQRIKSAYPIHPEVFDRLYTDWSTLPKFQRTRGVLRLMAAVINNLWETGDSKPLIMPSHISIAAGVVRSELTRYLPDGWVPILEKDVDGPSSLPLQIDSRVSNLGKLSACRRVARTLFLGSAPTVTDAPNRGLDDRRIKLGCVMPGESPAIFTDALRRLATSATYLYQDDLRYWYSTQPTVTKLAEDRAAEYRRKEDAINQELMRKLRQNAKHKGHFSRIHVAPQTSSEVEDAMDCRLVILNPDNPHRQGGDSPARDAAEDMLQWCGKAPRQYKNTLVFLALDDTRWQDLGQAIARRLAWQSILAETDQLNLTHTR